MHAQRGILAQIGRRGFPAQRWPNPAAACARCAARAPAAARPRRAARRGCCRHGHDRRCPRPAHSASARNAGPCARAPAADDPASDIRRPRAAPVEDLAAAAQILPQLAAGVREIQANLTRVGQPLQRTQHIRRQVTDAEHMQRRLFRIRRQARQSPINSAMRWPRWLRPTPATSARHSLPCQCSGDLPGRAPPNPPASRGDRPGTGHTAPARRSASWKRRRASLSSCR